MMHRFFGSLLLLTLSAATAAAANPAEPRKTVLIEFTGPIYSLSAAYLDRKIDDAQQLGAQRLIIEIDSPGGEIDATIRLAQRLNTLAWAETVAYIPREALSGAAIVALGCDQIAIAPDALLGDAGPIFLDEDFLFKHAPEKVRSHLAQQLRALAQAHGRPPALAEAMVDMELEVYRYRNRQTGETTYMSETEQQARADAQDWEQMELVLESQKGRFLEVNGRRAVELGLAEVLANDRTELFAAFPPLGEPIVLQWNTVDTLILLLNHPVATFVLLVIGLVALYVEFASAGLGAGGVVALIAFGLFFWSHLLGGTAQWLELVLFLLGVGLILVEIFVIPGFGIWGASGGLLIVASVVLASQTFVVPSTERELTTLLWNLGAVMSALMAFVIAAYLITIRLPSIPILNRLQLAPPAANPDDAMGIDNPASSEQDIPPPGTIGVTESPLRPAGKARFGERVWDVASDGVFVDRGQRVRVVRIDGRRILVRPAASPAAGHRETKPDA